MGNPQGPATPPRARPAPEDPGAHPDRARAASRGREKEPPSTALPPCRRPGPRGRLSPDASDLQGAGRQVQQHAPGDSALCGGKHSVSDGVRPTRGAARPTRGAARPRPPLPGPPLPRKRRSRLGSPTPQHERCWQSRSVSHSRGSQRSLSAVGPRGPSGEPSRRARLAGAAPQPATTAAGLPMPLPPPPPRRRSGRSARREGDRRRGDVSGQRCPPPCAGGREAPCGGSAGWGPQRFPRRRRPPPVPAAPPGREPAGSRPASASPQRLPHPSRGRGGHGPQGAVLAGSAGGGVGRVVTRGRGGGAASEEFGKQAAGEIPRETCTLLPAPWGSLPGLPGTPGTCCPRPPAPAVLATDTPAASSSGCADPSLQPLPGTPEHWSTHGLSAAHSEPLLQRPPLPLRRPLSARSHFSHKSVDHANGVVDQAELLERGERCSP